MIIARPSSARHQRLLLAAAAIAAALTTAVASAQRPRGVPSATGDAPLVLGGDTALLVGAGEPGPVAAAARDLAADFEKVLGRKPRIVQRPEEAGASIVAIGFRSPMLRDLRQDASTNPESFSLSVKAASWNG